LGISLQVSVSYVYADVVRNVSNLLSNVLVINLECSYKLSLLVSPTNEIILFTYPNFSLSLNFLKNGVRIKHSTQTFTSLEHRTL